MNKDIHQLRKSINTKFLKIHSDEQIIKEYDYASKQPSILYMDTDTSNLNNFYTNLKADYHVFLSHNIDTTIDILNKEQINIFIIEKHPKTLDILTKIKSKFQKHPLFLIISDIINEELINTFKDISVFKFVNKPLNINDLKGVIEEASVNGDVENRYINKIKLI